MEQTNPKVKIAHLQKELVSAIRTINKFLKINDIKLKYTLVLDYKINDFGLYFADKKFEIYINPNQFHDTSKESPHALYYSTDFSIISVTLHEFSHMLCEIFGITQKYKETFSDKLILNDNSRKDRDEEIAESLRLFFLNSFFLKLISPERYEFFCNLFKSPSACNKRNFMIKWRSWSPEIHQLCYETWGIKVVGTRIFSREVP